MALRLFVLLFAAVTALSGGSSSAGSTPSSPLRGHPTAHRAHAAAAQPNVPQSQHRRGEPGYKVMPVSAVRSLPASGRKGPIFHGGKPAPPSTTIGSAASTRAPLSNAGLGLFNGLNKAGMTADNETPPDSTGAVSPSYYVEMDNSNLAVYDRSLNLVSGPVALDTFLGASNVPFCDPQVEWDPAADRFLFVFLYCNMSDSVQRVVFGWTTTNDPTSLTTCPTPSGGNPATHCGTGWCQFAFDNDPFLLDYPKLGHSSKYLIVGGNLYDETSPSGNPPFVSAGMEWAPLPANGDDTCPLPASSANTSIPLKNGDGNTPTFTPVPINTTSNAADVWIVSAYDPGGNVGSTVAGSKLSTWDLDSKGVIHARADVNVTSYQFPSAAAQSGSAFTIDTLDGRLTQAEGEPATGIYTQHTVLDSSGRAQVDWYELVQSGANLVLAQQGNIDTANAWTFNAAISPRFDGRGAAIFYNVSSSSQDPSIVAQIRLASTAAGTFEPTRRTLATSPAPDTETLSCGVGGFPCRWGDYSGATPDPANPTAVWGTNMFNTASGSSPAWSDQNFAVVVGLQPHSPTGIAAAADGRGDASVTWTASTFDPETPIVSYTIVAYSGVTIVQFVAVLGASAVAGEVQGLTSGQTYTFTVLANDVAGSSPESAHSNPVVIAGITQASPAPAPSPRGVAPVPTASPPSR